MKLDHISEEYAIYGMFEEPPTLTEVGPLIGCSYQNVKRMETHLQEAEQNRNRTDEFMQQLYY